MDANNSFTPLDRLFSLGAQSARLYRDTGVVKAASVSAELQKAMRSIEYAHEHILRRFGSSPDLPSACEWLLDNKYVAVKEAKAVRRALSETRSLRSCNEGALLFVLCGRLVASGEGVVTEKRCFEFLSGFQTVTVLTHFELLLFPVALRHALLLRLSALCDELLKSSEPESFGDAFAAVFTSLTALSDFDMKALCDSVDLTEQLLLSDPAGIYGKCDERTRNEYRRRIVRLARHSGKTEHECAAELIKRARENNVHIGTLLFEDKRRSALPYIAANLLLTLFLSVLCGFLSHSVAAAFLLLLPLSELTKSLLDYLLLLITEPRPVLKLDLSDGIPDEGRSICVLSVLIGSADAAVECAKRLEEIYLLNRDGNGNLSFGLLADLPEAKTAVTDKDAAVLSVLKTELCALDGKYGGGFFLFTRPRRETADGRFCGFERKRGAVLALASLLCGEPNDLHIAVGNADALCGTRYIVTLDGDTVPAPDSIRVLIGAALHPKNRCVVSDATHSVVSGYGILHPRIGTELESAYANDFSRIFGGVGGTEAYCGLCGEVYFDLFDSGGFYGKGLIDAKALLICSKTHIPDGKVLSHDALEGALLRGGFVSDVEFCDAFPATPLAYYRRSHRWIRGDLQNAAWIFSRNGSISDIDRFKLSDSLRRSLVPVLSFVSIFLGLLLSAKGLTLALIAAVLSLAVGALISLTEALCESRRSIRYHSGVLHGVASSLLRSLMRLWLLPYEAWICFSASVTALWRMLVTKKGLLQWETASQSGSKRHGALSYFKNMWFAPVTGLALVLLSPSIIAKTVGLMWLVSPLCLYALSIPCRREQKLPENDRDYLLCIAKDIWKYFSTFCTAEENYLPPDNFQVQPPIGVAHRTSPTDIGLALCSALCATELGIDGGRGIGFIENMLGTLERMPKKYGHFYNWYDTRTLRPLQPKYLSSVDCGNLLACLIAVKNGLIKHRFFAAAKRLEAIIAPMDLSVFYDPKRKLMYIGIDAEKDVPTPAHYDLFASEARLTSYLAVAKGDVPKKHWEALSRVMRRYRGYSGMASWTGTMFEYLMPELFLPMYRNGLIYETAKYCVFVQKHRRTPSGIWGISESCFFSLDPSLSYRYKAHGCSALALKRDQDKELVISPYSAFLALDTDTAAALRNIKRMEAHALRSEYGFIEALDLTPSRCSRSEGEPVRCYMAHHLGMSLVAICNLLTEDGIVSMLQHEPYVRAYRGLLAEKLPLSPVVLELSDSAPTNAEKRQSFEKRGEVFDFLRPSACLLSNGAYSVMSTESGISAASCGDMMIYTSPKCPVGEGRGVELMLCDGDGEVSLLPEPNIDYLSSMWELSESSCSYSLETEDFSVRSTLAVSAAANGELRFIELCAKHDIDDGEIVLRLEPVLANAKDYVNHPAYWRLGMYAEAEDGCLMLKRLPRGRQGEMHMCLACDREISFSADRNGSVGAISKPLVTLRHRVRLKAKQTVSLRFCICVAESKKTAYDASQLMLATGPSDYAAMVSAYACALDLGAKQLSEAMSQVTPLHFFMRKNVFAAKELLWKYGISGDRPIVLVPLHVTRSDIVNAVLRHCLLFACGLEHDLVLLSDEGGDYFRPVYSAVRDTLCAKGLEPLMADGGSVHIVPAKAQELLLSRATVIYGFDDSHTRLDGKLHIAQKHIRNDSESIEYDFSDGGAFKYYVNSLPPRAWTHMLTNGHLGYIAADNGCGNMWLDNAREMRISPWQNDPSGEYPAETLEFVSNGKRHSLFAVDDGFGCHIVYGFGYARWQRSFGETCVRCTAFIPPETDARVFLLELCGTVQGSFDWKMPLCLGASDNAKNSVSVSYVNSMLEAKSIAPSFPYTLRAAFNETPLFCRTDLYDLLRNTESGDGIGSYPVFAVSLPAAVVSVIVCGTCEPDVLKELCKPDAAVAALERTKRHWQNALSAFKLKSRFTALDHYMNGHGLYQSLACRIMGRCSIYQSGGAIGFRDQLQDAVNLIFSDPSLARRQIILSCAHQYLEGDVMHWWHPLPDGDRGVRTRCSDDLLWLPWALCEYTEKTGDLSICDVEEYYVNSSPLSDAESDRYEKASVAALSESVLLHAKRAVDLVIRRGTGSHGLLLFGSGDWNDGMDKVGGESVWLSWFFAHTVRRFSELLLSLCKLEPDRYRAEAERIGNAANAAWDGTWYLRGYWEDGSPLGSAADGQCSIDSVAQSWAAFCSDASNSRVDLALDSALGALRDPDFGITKLFTPPFFEPVRDPGYIASYGAGFRENGGQYTHAAVWLAAACLRRGREKEGMAILLELLPENHDTARYEAEPFVLPADVYSARGHEGEAGWTWYTGSAAWYLRVVIEELFGLKLYSGKLYIRPRLPDGASPCRICFAGHDICINGEEILLDGEKYDGKGIPYFK